MADDMADDAAAPVDLADQPELVRVDKDDDNSIVYVTVVDIHAPERSSDFCFYRVRRNQKMKILFQGHAERNRHSNIHRFVFLLNGVRVTPECTIGSLDYNNSCDCLKLTPIEDWIRKSVQLVNARPIQSNDLELPRPSSRIDPHLHSLSIRNSLNVEQIRHARYTYRINSKWKNNWGFSFRSDSYYEEETILTTDRSVPQRISYVNYAQGHLTVEGSIFFRQTKFREDDIVKETICVCRVVNGNEHPSSHANPVWCLPMVKMHEEDEENPDAFDEGYANSIDEKSFADFITRFGTYRIYVESVSKTTLRSNN